MKRTKKILAYFSGMLVALVFFSCILNAATREEKRARKEAKYARQTGQQTSAPLPPLKPAPFTKDQAKSLYEELFKIKDRIKKLPHDPTLISELATLAKTATAVPEISKIETGKRKQPLATMIKKLETGFLFDPAFKAAKKKKDFAARIAAFQDIVTKFNPIATSSAARTDVKQLFGAISKTRSKVTPKTQVAYKALLVSAQTKYAQIGTRKGITNRKLRNAYKAFKAIHDRIVAGAFQNMKGALKVARAKKPISARITAFNDLLNKFVLIKGDKVVLNDALDLLSEIRDVTSRLTLQTVIKYKSLLIAANSKLGNLKLGKLQLLKKRTYNKFKKLHAEMLSGFLDAVVKIKSIKRKTSINRRMQILEEILRDAPPAFYKKKKNKLKRFSMFVNSLVTLGRKVRSSIRKKRGWNDALVDRFTRLATNARIKNPSQKNTIGRRISGLYDKELKSYNNAIKKINKTNKQIAELGKKKSKAHLTVQELGSVKLSKWALRKKDKLRRAKNTIKNYQKKVQKKRAYIEKKKTRMNQARQRLQKAPQSIKKKMKSLIG